MNTPKRYNPVLVTLHWLTVILLFGAGFLAEDEGGRSPINIHMILGSLLLLMLLIRVVVRLATKLPAWADTGNRFLNQLGGLVHLGLYLAAFFILGIGALIAGKRNLFAYVLGAGTAAGGRVDFLGALHQLGWVMVLGLVFLHVGAAFYHQFILKDNLLARMWYGK